MEKEVNNLERKVISSKRKNGFFSGLKRAVAGGILALSFAACPNPLLSTTKPSNPTNPQPINIDFSKVNSDLSNLNEYNPFSDKPYSIKENLPTTDLNGKTVTYASASSADANTTVELNGNNLSVSGNPGRKGKYGVNISYTDNGKSASTTLEGYLYNLLDVSGQLEDITHNYVPGIVRVYDSNNNPITINQIKMTTGTDEQDSTTNNNLIIKIDSSGNFNFQADERADPNAPLSSFTIEAGEGSYIATATPETNFKTITGLTIDGITLPANSTDSGYVRTIKLQNLTGDISSSSDPKMNPAIRVAPYVDIGSPNGQLPDGKIGTYQNYPNGAVGGSYTLNNEITDFQSYASEITSSPNNSNKIVNENDNNFEILSQGLDGSYFLQPEISDIESAISTWSSVITNQGKIAGRSGLTFQADTSYPTPTPNSNPGGNYHFTFDNYGNSIPNKGWTLIIPDKTGTNYPLNGLSAVGITEFVGLSEGEIIYLKAPVLEVDSHEEGHALYYPGNDDTILGPAYSIMYLVYNPSGITVPANSDIETMLEVHEETYQNDNVGNINKTSF